jgi:hypothetical protein
LSRGIPSETTSCNINLVNALGNLRSTGIPSGKGGGIEILLVASCYRERVKPPKMRAAAKKESERSADDLSGSAMGGSGIPIYLKRKTHYTQNFP